MQEFFESLQDAKVPYVVLSGYTELPFAVRNKAVVLTSNLKQFVKMGGLQLVRGQEYQFPLPTDGESAEFYVVPKSMGFYPDRFETELLTNIEHHNEVVRIPETSIRAYAHLYSALFRDNAWSDNPERRNSIKQMVMDRVGPAMPCRLDGILCFS